MGDDCRHACSPRTPMMERAIAWVQSNHPAAWENYGGADHILVRAHARMHDASTHVCTHARTHVSTCAREHVRTCARDMCRGARRWHVRLKAHACAHASTRATMHSHIQPAVMDYGVCLEFERARAESAHIPRLLRQPVYLTYYGMRGSGGVCDLGKQQVMGAAGGGDHDV